MARAKHVVWGLLCLVLVLAAGAKGGTIKNSLHDLSHIMQNSSMVFWDNYADYNQVCVYCHTPHNSLEGEQLLWNRTMPTGPYTLYRSESLISPVNAPGNHSLMCLSCHDGTIAVDAVVRMPITGPLGRPGTWSNPANPGEPVAFHGKMANPTQSAKSFEDCGVACHGGANISQLDFSGTYMGTDMADDHPVTIDYPNPLTYGNRFKSVPASQRWTNGIQLYSNKVECGSCHDVHNPDWKPFLRCNNDESALCFTCHNK